MVWFIPYLKKSHKHKEQLRETCGHVVSPRMLPVPWVTTTGTWARRSPSQLRSPPGKSTSCWVVTRGCKRKSGLRFYKGRKLQAGWLENVWILPMWQRPTRLQQAENEAHAWTSKWTLRWLSWSFRCHDSEELSPGICVLHDLVHMV